MKFFKAILIIIMVVMALIIAGFFLIGYSVVKFGEEIVAHANKPVVQKIEKGDKDNPIITVPLQEKRGLIYESIMLCKPQDREDDFHFKKVIVPGNSSHGSTCANGACRVWVDIDGEIPKSIQMYVLKDGACKQENFETKGHEEILGYQATIDFDDELLQTLGITSSEYKIGAANTGNISSWQIFGTRKVKFSYPSVRNDDDLIIDGITKAHIKYK